MNGENLVVWLVVGSALPLLAVTATAFAKASILLGILRGGLGVPGALPASVVAGLAAVLAALVMAPVARDAAEAVGPLPGEDPAAWAAAAERAWPVLEDFLVAHTPPDRQALVMEAAVALDPTAELARPSPADRVAAFLLSELQAAFQLGVLLLLPFLIVDLLVASTLTTVGFSLLPPTLIALPFKLLLFVAADGWGLLVRGFVRSYG
ncbi:MAG: EscR/YscR/HrcR family type III secretion system export apparatus protein [Myxococcales bacterium]|nr:EscR/YscR/HrcR family type III secretion system export apparatus protein [Myxococcales bacterium]